MFSKRDGWLNFVPEKMTHEYLHDPYWSFCLHGRVYGKIFVSQLLMGNLNVICDISNLFGDVVSKQRISKLRLCFV